MKHWGDEVLTAADGWKVIRMSFLVENDITPT